MKYLISLTLAVCTLTARAQTEQPSGAWTLEQCMLFAVENSPETNIQTVRNRNTGLDYLEAIGRLLPSVRASVGADFSFGRGLDPNTNTYSTISSFGNSYGASTGMTIFAGMTGINNLRMQKINRMTGRHQLEQKRDDVALATMEAFFNVLYYKKMVVLAESQLEESRLNLRQTERMEELGVKGFPDVAEMRAQEAQYGYILTNQQNMLAIGIILLKEAMNFPIESELDTAPFDTTEEVAKNPETAAGIYSRALGYLPKARVAESSAEASRIALRIARGRRLPSISMSAGYSTAFNRSLDNHDYEPFSNQFRNNRGYGVGATLSIPIFSGFQTTAGVNRAKNNLTIARIERDDALRALYTEIEQAVADMNGAADQFAQAVRQRESAAVAQDVNRRKYDEGLVSALELHTSSNRLVEARAAELRSRLTYILKKRRVDYFSGTPLIDETTVN